MIEELESRVRREVLAQPVPEPTEAQVQAILFRRAAGERVSLPADTAGRTMAGRRWLVVAALATAASLVLVSHTGMRPARSGDSPAAARALRMLGPDDLLAEVSDHPTYPVVRAERPLSPGRWVYHYAGPFRRSGQPAQWALARSDGAYEGKPAYRYSYGAAAPDRSTALPDTAWLDRETLRLLARTGRNPVGGRVEQVFRETTVLTGHTTVGGMTSWSSVALDSIGPLRAGGGRMPTDIYEAGALLPWRMQLAATLESADLHEGWRGSMQAVGTPFADVAIRYWLNLEVVGSETVTVPAGTFEAWKISTGPGSRLVAWVSKDRQWLLRLGTGDGAQELVRGGE